MNGEHSNPVEVIPTDLVTPWGTMKEFDEISRNDQIERWENVLRVLEGLGPHERAEHWDMSLWGRKTECGTVACAAGHCGLDPWFRERGFTMNFAACNCGAPGCTTVHIKSTDLFFGKVGADSIFHNCARRSVDAVINEVKGYLQELRS